MEFEEITNNNLNTYKLVESSLNILKPKKQKLTKEKAVAVAEMLKQRRLERNNKGKESSSHKITENKCNDIHIIIKDKLMGNFNLRTSAEQSKILCKKEEVKENNYSRIYNQIKPEFVI